MNTSHPPFRPPCSGTITCSNGPRYQHGNTTEQNIPVFLYNTTVCDWHWANCPNSCVACIDCGDGMIAPYERWAAGTSSSPCPSPCSDVDGCGEPPCQPCGPWNWSVDNPAPAPSYYQPQMVTAATIANGGTGYRAGDVLTESGGTTSSWIARFGIGGTSLNITVTAVNGAGTITAIKITQPGSFQTNPSSPNSMTGGHGTGASINLTFGNQTENLTQCFKYGFKNVQAKRQWHGAPGYFWLGPVAEYRCPDGLGTGENCNWNFFSDYSLNAPQTKYLTITYDMSCELIVYNEDGSVDSDTTITQSGTVSVDAQTGVITASDIVDTGDVFGTFTDNIHQINIFPVPLDTDPLTVLSGFSGPTLSEGGDFLSDYASDPSDYSLSCSDDGWSATYLGTGQTVFQTSWSIGSSISGSIEWDTATGNTIANASFSMSDDSFSYSYFENDNPGDPGQQVFLNVSITLSDPNTPSDVQSDIVTLLDEWDLSDDAEYPWRNDQYVSIAPLVTRNEVPGNVSPWDAGLPLASGYTDANAAIYDGTIMGSPLPAGYQGTFDFNYIDAQWCDTGDAPGTTCDPGINPSSFQVQGYGSYMSELMQLPQNATQWTDNPTAAGLPGGAWIFYNHNPSYTGCGDRDSCYTYAPFDGCIAQKWAETKLGFVSQNFARPAGDDKFSYDEDNVYTINSSSTTDGVTEVYLVNSVNCTNANASPSLGSGLWGGASVNGFFEVSGNGSPFTLGTKIFDVPSDWDTESGTWNASTASFDSDSNTAFGLLRWPNSPAIIGLAGVSDVANSNGNTELSTISIPSLGMGITSANTDYIDLYDKNLNLLSANAAVTRVDDTHFKVPVSFATAQNTTYIASNGAAPYYWDDATPKGDYVYTDWTWWPRLICEASRINTLANTCANTANCNCSSITTETIYCNPFYDPASSGFDDAYTQEGACVSFNPCNPSVLCISPNDESFPVGHTYGFKTIQFDEQYGSGWQAEFQQVMVDLLYQQPHYPAIAPCMDAPFAWLEDDGTCNEGGGTSQYFPHAPMVEARITLPDNGGPNSNSSAPSLPNGVTIGWASPAGINSNCGSQPSDVLFPPNAVGFGLESATTFSLWSNECTCIDALGRFAADYSESVLGCQ